MPVTIKLRFPAGRYHATPWGRHVNEGVPEWPPSPWRLLRALVAVWKRTCPNLPEGQVQRLLMALTHPPRFKLPPHRVAHTRHAMPMNVIARNYRPSEAERKAGKFQGDPSIVFDTFVSVGRNDPLFIGWPDAELSAGDRVVLAELLGNLSSLGRAEGWVHAELFEGTVDLPLGPADASDPNPVPVFCPDPSSAFGDEHYPRHDPNKLAKGKVNPADFLFDCPRWHLCLDTETIHNMRWPTVPGAKWVNYTSPHEADSARAKTKPRERPKPTVARFLLDGPVLPLVKDTVRVAEAFRAVAMSYFNAWCHKQPPAGVEPFRRIDRPDRYTSQILSGKDANGRFLPGHDHAHYLPTAEGDDPRRLTHVTVYAPGGFGGGETAALTGLRKLKVGDLVLRTQLVGLGRPSDFRAALFGGTEGAARVWESATPYVGPAHVGRSGRERYLRKSLRRELRRQASLWPAGVEVEVEAIPTEDLAAAGRPRPIEFKRGRNRAGDDGNRRPFGAFRVTFSAPIPGPLCLGYASHFGLGLFLPRAVSPL